MLRTRLSSVGRSKSSMRTDTAAAVRICNHHRPGVRTATPAPARAPTASMISTRSRDKTSATASRKARLSQIAQLFSPSQSVKFSPTVYPPSFNGARSAEESPPDHAEARFLSSPPQAADRGPELRSRSDGSGDPPAPGLLQIQRQLERRRQMVRSQGVPQLAGGNDPPTPHQQSVGDAVGNLFHMVGD